MIVIIRYTHPKLLPNQIQDVFETNIPCSDTDAFPNGAPKPDQEFSKWNFVFANIENQPDYEIVI